MAWTAPRTWVAAETLTAALLNTHVRDNMLETAVAKVTTAGDIAYATGANALTRLGIGSYGAVLASTGTAPRWSSSAVTANAGAAINVQFVNTLTAAANSDLLEACQIYATIATGTYTGLTAYGLYLSGMAKTGTGTVDNAYGLYLTPPTLATTNYALYIPSGNSVLGGTSSKVFIGDTANANMTAGLTINQGGADNEAVTLKSSDIAHGITGFSETDTYGYLSKASAAAGGLRVQGLSQSGISAGTLTFSAVQTDATSTNKNTSANGIIILDASTASGTGGTAAAANTNLVSITTGGNVRFIFDADGDSHEDGTGWTAYDDFDDVALLKALDHSLDKRLSAQASAWLRENKAALQAARIVTFNDDTDGVPFINKSRLGMLLVGAVRQMAARVDELEGRLLALSA